MNSVYKRNAGTITSGAALRRAKRPEGRLFPGVDRGQPVPAARWPAARAARARHPAEAECQRALPGVPTGGAGGRAAVLLDELLPRVAETHHVEAAENARQAECGLRRAARGGRAAGEGAPQSEQPAGVRKDWNHSISLSLPLSPSLPVPLPLPVFLPSP
eukprot:SAG31_NODE_3268_length_4478_cov_2.701987_8_plen_160_part_00